MSAELTGTDRGSDGPDDTEAVKTTRIAGVGVLVLLLGLVIAAFVPELGIEGGTRWTAPAWLYTGIFVVWGVVLIGWAAVRALRVRMRDRDPRA